MKYTKKQFSKPRSNPDLRPSGRGPFADIRRGGILAVVKPVLLAACVFLIVGAREARAQVPSANAPALMTYQGYLVDANGAPLATNAPQNYDVIFRIYDASQSGNNLWAEQQTVTVDKGYFSVLLGEGSPYSSEPHPNLAGLFATNNASDRYVEITVKGIGSGNSDVTILPRLRLLTSPYAFLAQNAISANTAQSVSGAAVTSGTVSDARLSSNVALRSGGNTFSGTQIFDNHLGIGTSTPGFPLTFSGLLGDKISLWGPSGNSYGFGIQNSLLQIHTDSSGSDIAFGYGSSANMTETMRIKGNGNVGIGTSYPAARLHVTSTGYPVALFDGSGIYGTWLDLHNSTANSNYWHIISTGSGNGEGAGKLLFTSGAYPNSVNSEPLVLTPRGVGIGTASPTKAALEVEGYQTYSLSAYEYLNSVTYGHESGSGGNQAYSIYAAGRIACSELDVFSDARLKKILGRSDSRQDLKTLMGIQITDYTMVDKVANGNRQYKKVIAQQVEKVYPQAVSCSTNVVPDIYAKADAKAGWIPLTKHLNPPLKVGDKVQLITEKNTALHEVTEVKADGFRIKEPLSGPVFVYGRRVNDFRTVDYGAISMLNVSATQELYRELQAKDAEVRRLKQEVEGVAAREQAQAARFEKLEAMVTHLNPATQTASASMH